MCLGMVLMGTYPEGGGEMGRLFLVVKKKREREQRWEQERKKEEESLGCVLTKKQ